MTKPEWDNAVPANEFYGAPGYECPKCCSKLLFDCPTEQIMAMDVQNDRCPNCGTSIVLNMLSTPVHVEGFSDEFSVYARLAELSEQYGTEGR